MFSQFRHALESVAPPRRSVDESAGFRTGTPDHSNANSPLSTSAPWSGLSDTAITGLRKLPFGGHRSASPAPSGHASHASLDRELQSVTSRGSRLNLEDRLKARFAIGDSPGDTPDASGRVTPAPPAEPKSPRLVPLPDSLPSSPILGGIGHDSKVDPVPSTVETVAPGSDEVGQADNPSEPHPGDASHASNIPLPTSTSQEIDDPLGGVSNSLPETFHREGSSFKPDHAVKSTALTEKPILRLTTVPREPLIVVTAETPAVSPLPAASHAPSGMDVSNEPSEENGVADVDSTSLGEHSGDATPPVPIVPDNNAPTDAPPSDTDNAQDDGEADVERLRERLKLVEQRFSDVSTSFKKLQAEKRAADKILQELTSVQSVQDAKSLRDYLQNITLKVEMSQDEIKRLTGKLARQDERLGELRDIHHMEAKSQNDLIDKLRRQLEESKTALKSSQDVTSKAEDEMVKRKAEIEKAHAEVEKARTTAKEEEEKRVKAVSLLKTVRQKLVKTEKERDDAVKESGAGKEKEREEREKEKAERARLQAEIEHVNADREKALAGMKAHFDREVASMKERHEKEINAIKARYENDATASKATFSKELSGKDARISTLEKSISNTTQEKNRLFEQLQMRQAEFESSQSHLESLQAQTAELNYQLRESGERIALLTDELSEVRREQDGRAKGSAASAEEAARVLALTEARFEAKLAESRKRLQSAERERADSEAEWAKKFEEKMGELAQLRKILDASARGRDEKEETVAQIRAECDRLKEEIVKYRDQVADLRREAARLEEAEGTAKEDIAQLNAQVAALQKSLEDSKDRESQLRTSSKTLREELRKVQSSAALLERQRNPGLGYWARTDSSSAGVRSPEPRTSLEIRSQASENGAEPPTSSAQSEEEVNLEYIRNVILQFLEHPAMRPNLVRVLSAVLRFTPQETRRLVAKV